MNELLAAAKAVIEDWNSGMPHDGVSEEAEDALRAAVERAENPPAYFMEWWETFPLKTDDVVPAVHAWEAGFTAAQQAERERIKEIIHDHRDVFMEGGLCLVVEKIDDVS